MFRDLKLGFRALVRASHGSSCAFLALAPADFPRIGAIGIDPRVLAFAGALAIATSLVAALAPAIHLMRANLDSVLRGAGSRGATSGRARTASRALVVVEMTLAFALVAASGLLAKSVMCLDAQDLGFTRAPMLTFSVGLPPFAAPDNAAAIRIHTDFLAQLRGIPGVSHASAINLLPIARTGTNGPVRRADAPDGQGIPVTEFRCVMDGYFDAMDVRFVAGRVIDGRDTAETSSVAVLNDTLAAKLFPGLDPARIVGQSVRIGWLRGIPSEVVGVVTSVRSRRPDAPPDPEVYVPFAQAPAAALSYVVRGSGDVSALAGPIRSTFAGVAGRPARAGPHAPRRRVLIHAHVPPRVVAQRDFRCACGHACGARRVQRVVVRRRAAHARVRDPRGRRRYSRPPRRVRPSRRRHSQRRRNRGRHAARAAIIRAAEPPAVRRQRHGSHGLRRGCRRPRPRRRRGLSDSRGPRGEG